MEDLAAAADPAGWTREVLAAITPQQEARQVRAAAVAVWEAVQEWQDGLTRRQGRHLRSTIGACPPTARCVVCRVHGAIVVLEQLPATADIEDVIAAAGPAVDIAVPATTGIETTVEQLRAIGWHRHSLIDRPKRTWQWFTPT